MYLQKNTEICVMHAISPVHAGAGSATGAVDLPIQRERHTGWPHIQASGVKGAFRDHCERVWMLKDIDIDKLVTKEKKERALELGKRIFGKSDGNDSQAGAIAFSDARLLAFPVRSNAAPFVWVVCPALLKRLARDLELAGKDSGTLSKVAIEDDKYCCLNGNITNQVILEDICLSQVEDGDACQDHANILLSLNPDLDRLLLIPDNHFAFLVETATEVQAQISINPDTGTTNDGSLRYEELLPADTVLYTVVCFGNERAEDENIIVTETLRKAVKDAASSHIQMGGDMTLGRGIFRIDWAKEKGGAA